MAHRPSPRRLRYRVGSKHQSQLSRRLRLDFARIATHLRPPGPLAVIRASFPSSDSVVCDTQERAAGSARTWAMEIYNTAPPARVRAVRARVSTGVGALSSVAPVSRLPSCINVFSFVNTDRPARPPARESESATRSPARVRRGVRETRYRFRLPRYRNGTPPPPAGSGGGGRPPSAPPGSPERGKLTDVRVCDDCGAMTHGPTDIPRVDSRPTGASGCG